MLILMKPFDQPFFSIIVPTFNEEKNPFFLKTLESFSHPDLKGQVELIITDRCSTDLTQQIAQNHGALVIKTQENSRAGRLNIGYQQANGKIIFFHHPRSTIDIEALHYIKNNYDFISWGGLTHTFDLENSLLQFTSWYSNNVRGKLKQILYLDHCIFFRKDLFHKQYKNKLPLPIVDIFEDSFLSLRLQSLGDITILPFKSLTSSIRFHSNGIWKQSLMNQWLKIAFYLELPLGTMNKVYEKGLSLNSQYKNDT